MFRFITFAFIFFSVVCSAAAEEINFNRDIRPVLSKKCFQCHGPDEAHRRGDLRLDRADGSDGALADRKGVFAVKPADLEESELWYRINTDDADDVMPPPDSHVAAVTLEERELIQKWILGGGKYSDFWAFVPAAEVVPPTTQKQGWSDLPIDRFVLAQLEKDGLTPKARADKRTLIRRVTFDLTGLPPTVGEIDEFLADDSADAYQKLIDRLLAEPQYGEHMAKYWLDLVRFADTNGMHHDHYRDMTPYRDWVIRSFNDNLPYDQFVTDQIAGDLHAEPDTDQLIASGFNRLHLIIDVGTALPEESFTKNVIDRVSAVGTAFMGLTLQCAVCHDHKFDPITQKDFFQMYAFFNNFAGKPETGRRGTLDFKRGLQVPYIEIPTEKQKAALAKLEAEIAVAEGDGKKPLQKRRDALKMEIPAAMVMKERADPRPAHILIRGVYDNPGEQVERGTPSFLPPMADTGKTKTRMDLAKWLVEPSNPLTARVAVNRFWQQFFGVGLVKTSEDFGAQGEWPSHPELLDHLTTEFVKGDWNVKAIVRAIVLSETYQQSSRALEEEFVNDPDNRKLSRGSRFRLDSEMVRDQLLASTGLLNTEMYGKSVKPPQPEGLWKIVAMPSAYPREYKPDTGGDIFRRSVYTFWKRGLPPPQMSIFDAPTRDSCIARRERTNTPLQALLLMNEEQFFGAARHFAAELLNATDMDDAARLDRAYEVITSKEMPATARDELQSGLDEFRKLYTATPDEAAELAPDVKEPAARAELAAWTMIVHSLLNLDLTKTRE